MKPKRTDLLCLLHNGRFPQSVKYDPAWTIANEMGPNALWLTEALCEKMELAPGMRVLDMGCGRAMSSIFLAKEFGVEVWATDPWIGATENWQRIREAGVEDRVFPIHAEAHALPFAHDFFDAIVSLDSYHYYGTDVHYLEFHMLKLLKRSGRIGIVSFVLRLGLGPDPHICSIRPKSHINDGSDTVTDRQGNETLLRPAAMANGEQSHRAPR